VIEAGLVVLLGAGLTLLGILEGTLYDIGVVVIFVGLIGVLVRAVEWARRIWYFTHPPARR
jgi:hypothetical protein